nr:MUTS family DNA binding domain protein [Mimivirus sp.]URM62540.1 MUTS family DNA binding domain protein [Mimivirus sp.]
MNNLEKIKIKGVEYYFGNDIVQLHLPGLKKYTNGRRLVEDQEISEKNYMFVRHNGKSWMKSSDKSCKYDKIIIKTDYVEKNIFPKESDSDDEDNDNNDSDNDSEEEDNEITIAPGIIKLTKKEKMKDNSGNIIEIEVRGTRDHDNCYFRVGDVAVGFGMKELHKTIIHKNRGYEDGIHYQYFYIDKNVDNDHKNKKVKSKKPLSKNYS